MLHYYIKIALRNFKSNKVIFAGSLLTLGLCALSTVLLGIYLYNELTVNDFHKRKDDIYVFVNKVSPLAEWEFCNPSFFLDFNREAYPEVETSTTLKKYEQGDLSFVSDNNTYYPEGLVVDSSFFNVFNFDLVIGEKATVLNERDALLISTDLADRMFGRVNPIGFKVTVGDYMSDVYTVRGVFEKPKTNSSISFDFILPDSKEPNQYATMGAEFLLMRKGANMEDFAKKIEKLGENHFQFTNSITGIKSFRSCYFNEDSVSYGKLFTRHGNKRTIYILGVVLLVILFISAINMSNLQFISTNVSVKLIALSVINGAGKNNIVFQKIIELLILTILASLLASLAYVFLLPTIHDFIDYPQSIPLWIIVALCALIVFTIALFALIYPVLIALNLPVIKSLKYKSFFSSRMLARKNVMTAQFVLTFVLLISTIVVIKQLNMMLDKEIGFKNANVISTQLYKRIPIPIELFSPKYKESKEDRMRKFQASKDKAKKHKQVFELVKNEMKSNPDIVNFAQGTTPLAVNKMPWKVKEASEKYQEHNTLTVSPNYLDVFGLELLEGRFFDLSVDQSSSNKIVINEAAKKYWNIDNIESVRIANKFSKEGYEIIGVVKDFHSEHLSSRIKPLVMAYFEDPENDFLIEFEQESVSAGLQFVQESFKKINPDGSFNYSFVSDDIAQLYDKDKQLSTIYIAFTVLALLISAIGLFIIAMYDTQRRVKEIGIRKVNGAKTYQVLTMLNKDFTKNVLIAFIISCPISYLLMTRWLENFAYKTTLSWWVFVLAGIFTLTVALVTVTVHSYKAANANPVKSLRTE